MLTVAGSPVIVPSPLNWISSTIAFGCAAPPTMLNPEAWKAYKPFSVALLQVLASASSALACATPDTVRMIAPATAHAVDRVEMNAARVGFLDRIVLSYGFIEGRRGVPD